MMFLTDDELQALTGYKRRDKQKVLATQGPRPLPRLGERGPCRGFEGARSAAYTEPEDPRPQGRAEAVARPLMTGADEARHSCGITPTG